MSKSKVEKQIEELIELAHLWSDFAVGSPDAHGWDYKREDDEIVVKCYFAVDSDHKAVSFRSGRYELQIAFFKPEKLEFPAPLVGNLDKIISNARNLLTNCKKRNTIADKAAKKAEIEARKKYLARELKRLEELK